MSKVDLSLSIVIPVFNEAENVEPLLAELHSALQGQSGQIEFLFVDDGSADSTFAALRQAQQADSRVRIARFRRNHGQTAAMAAGFRLARGQAIVTLDGDLQNDPAEIPRLVNMLSMFDCVCGIRTRRQDSLWKRISSRIGNGFRNWATGDDIVDTGCTLKAFRRQCLEHLELYHGLHRFLPTLIKMRGFRIVQVPVNHRPRLRGKTKYGTWARLVKGLNDVWAVRWMKKRYLNYEADMDVWEAPQSADAAQPARDRAPVLRLES